MLHLNLHFLIYLITIILIIRKVIKFCLKFKSFIVKKKTALTYNNFQTRANLDIYFFCFEPHSLPATYLLCLVMQVLYTHQQQPTS